MDTLQIMEPFGNGNSSPMFIVNDLIIKTIKIIKEKHILLFFNNDHNKNLKGICFNSLDSELGDYLLNYKKYQFYFGCVVSTDNYNNVTQPQLVIKDAIIMN